MNNKQKPIKQTIPIIAKICNHLLGRAFLSKFLVTRVQFAIATKGAIKNDIVVAISQSGTTAALIESVKIVRKNGVKVIGIMPGDTPLADICDFPLTINIGINNRISKPLTSRIAYTAVVDVLTMGVAQLKPEAQDHLYNIADSQRSLKIDN